MAGEKIVYDQLKEKYGDPMEEAGRAFFNIFGKAGKQIDWPGVAEDFPPGTKFYVKSGVTGDWIQVMYAFGIGGKPGDKDGRSDSPGIKLPESRIEFKFDGVQSSYAAVIPDGPTIMADQGAKVVLESGLGSPESDLGSWAWTSKYLKAQRQVAQAEALLPKPITKPAPELTVQKLVVPAAALVLVWWLVA